MLTTFIILLVGVVSFVFGAYWGMIRIREIAEASVLNYILFLKYKLGDQTIDELNREWMNIDIKFIKKDDTL